MARARGDVAAQRGQPNDFGLRGGQSHKDGYGIVHSGVGVEDEAQRGFRIVVDSHVSC